jgi:aryl-alcohol dehydrogenase-like predicted oxidoreductase
MKYNPLGNSGIDVSEICLGSMTWGTQNDQDDANQQIEFALDAGINFIDTAEMYAVPPTADTYGATESIIGHWLKDNAHRRGEFTLATKIAGNGLPWIRDGADIDGPSITRSIDASLARLQTDYIDLYQLHWPNRLSPHFAKHWPGILSFSEVDAGQQEDGMLEILQALDQAIQAGKIRHFGLSDDTPWGINTYLKLAREHGLPRPVSIQNEFSLLHSKDWPYLIETCVHENISYLPWSPLAGGVLTGKYIDGARPAGSRWCKVQRNGFFRDTPAVNEAVKAYRDIAARHDMSAAQLALAWCRQVDGVTSTIIGATGLDQLQENIAAFSLELPEELLAEIDQTLRSFPLPF